MTDLPGPHAALPHTPGAHHVPKWAWIAGGAGIVGAVALFHHRQGQAAADTAAAMNDPGTAGYNAGAIDSAAANPNGDPTMGGYYPYLPGGSAPIVIGDPPPPDSGIVAPDTPGTVQLPTTTNITIGPITGNPDPQAPITGGGSASGVGNRNPKPSMTKVNHGVTANLLPLVKGKGPGLKLPQPKQPKPKKPPKKKGGPAGGKPIAGGGGGGGTPGPSVPMQPAPVAVAPMAAPKVTSASGVLSSPTPGAQAMPVTGGGLPGSNPGPMTPVPVSVPAPAPPKMIVAMPMAPPTLAVPPPPPSAAPPPTMSAAPPPSVLPPAMAPPTTHASMAQARQPAPPPPPPKPPAPKPPAMHLGTTIAAPKKKK